MEDLVQSLARHYVDVLPPPGDALYPALVAVLARASENRQATSAGTIRGTVTHPESPSVFTALRLGLAALGTTPAVAITAERIQTPDPRLPKALLDFEVWTYDGTVPSPCIFRPADALVEAIAALARLPFDVEAWEPHARSLGAAFGPASIPHLAASMVHASPPPEGFDAFEWVQRMQIAAALVLGQVDRGWRGSARMGALFSLALGPVDWMVTAAVIALGRIAAAEPGARADVERVFQFLRSEVGRTGYTCYAVPLALTWLRLVGPAHPRRADLVAWLQVVGRGPPDADETHERLYLSAFAELGVRVEGLQNDPGAVLRLQQEYGVAPGAGGSWNDAAARRPDVRAGLLREQAQARLRLRLRGLDPTTDEALSLMGSALGP